MSKVLILYYSSYGHMEKMAEAVAEGVRASGGTADIRRVPELVSEEVAASSGYKLDQAAPVATVDDLKNCDALVVGAGTRFGRMGSQMASFFDQAGEVWLSGALVGKVGAAFTSSLTQHGGQETTLFSILTNLLHFGMTIVGLDYNYKAQMGLDKVRGGSPYGATTFMSMDGSRAISDEDLEGARYLGSRVAETAARLASPTNN